MPFLFFKKIMSGDPGPASLPAGFTLEVWRPGRLRLRLRPRGFPALPFLVWGCWHFLRVFRSRDYAIVLIYQGEALVHRTCLLPAHFRFPFMRPGELQAAGIWTRPDRRGLGLGLVALGELSRRIRGTLWYMVREDNLPSIRLAEKAGFLRWGRGLKRVSLGGPLGCYEITEGLQARRVPWSRSRQPTRGED
ncbi:MAG: GNAT family N-acetyltransferase [Holophaga sp.]|nr:GNAT family N-acetyltransferase [Holophaga sp.]